MMTERITYRWLWSCLIAGGLLLLTGCADKSEEVPQPSPEPQPEVGSPLELLGVTRTSDASQIDNASCPDIRVYLTTATEMLRFDNNPYGTFQYTISGWVSNLSVKEEHQYYIYGYMPSSVDGSVEDLNGDYSKGIDLKLSNLPAITTDDICVLVGVQRVGSTSTTEAPNVMEGQYGFRSGIKGENFLNLLMAHLYAKLKLCFKIDPSYAELRSIHLKEITLTSKYADGAAVTLKLRDGVKGINPTFPIGTEGETEHTVTLLKEDTDPVKVLDEAFVNTALSLDIPAYCRPITAEGESQSYNLTLTTKYDVYDRAFDKTKNKVVDKNNLGERISVNKIKFSIAALSPGNEKVLVLTVKPTYLYILSDNDLDLDNPTITVN